MNYAEICYELEAITGKDLFNQEVLNSTINKLRARVNMPNLEEIGGAPAINGVVYDDPARTKWEPANDVPSMLWEIRRERRVELCYENGLRSADLKRWKSSITCAISTIPIIVMVPTSCWTISLLP